MQSSDERLKEHLVEAGLINREALSRLEEEAADKHTSFADAVLADGAVNEDELRKIHASILGIPFIDLKGQKIDTDVLSLIPEPVARRNNVVSYNKTEKGLEVAMLDVDDLQSIDFIKKKVGTRILPRLTDTASMKGALQQYQKSLQAEFGDIIKKDTAAIKMVREEEGTDVSEEELQKLAEDFPIVRIVDTLLKHAILQDASDIHIEQMEEQILVRYRIDGILHDAMTLPKHAGSGIVARIKVLASLKLDEKRLPQDGRFKIDASGERVSFRVSTLPTYYGEKVVMRLLRENVQGFTLETLGFHGEALEKIHQASKKTTGLILATGPTGSGKTTTLYTILDILNTPDVNISTIEDPVEYQVPRINQTQVKPDIGFTFSTGLRSLVRQDPDIIMVGEIRDHETAALAVNAALTGHLVLSTLHTNSAAGAVPRLLDMGVEPFLLASTLEVVIGQRLVRTLCKEKEEHKLSEDELENLRDAVDLDSVLTHLKAEGAVAGNSDWGKIPFYRPKKSDECPDGYKGRVGIHEVLTMSSSVRQLIMQHATSDDIETQARKEGMLTMIEDGIFQASQGRTSLEEVLRVVSE